MHWKRIDFPHSFFPRDEHYISFLQIETPISYTIPATINTSDVYNQKLKNAIIYTVKDNKSNIVVLPEISVPSILLVELIACGIESYKQRETDYGSCVICLPLEHLLADQVICLISAIQKIEGVRFADKDLTIENVLDKLFEKFRDIDKIRTFVNVATVVILSKTSEGVDCQIVFQPKIFPFKGEVDCTSIFAKGKQTYILRIGDLFLCTCICYDFIANEDIPGYYIFELFSELHKRQVDISYLLLPQCNSRALDRNYAETLFRIYSSHLIASLSLRIISPNTYICTPFDPAACYGNSWMTICPFNAKIPKMEGWEYKLKIKAKLANEKEDQWLTSLLGSFGQRFRASATGEWLINAALPSTEALNRAAILPTYPQQAIRIDILSWQTDSWSPYSIENFSSRCRAADQKLTYLFFKDLYNWVESSLGVGNVYTPSLQEFNDDAVTLPQIPMDRATNAIYDKKDVFIFGDHSCGKTIFGISIVLKWIREHNGKCLYYDFRDFFNEESFENNVNIDFENYIHLESKPLVILLDNVHLCETQARIILSRVNEMRSQSCFVAVILLSLRLPFDTGKYESLLKLVSTHIELVADEEAFVCVAKRLCQKAEITYSMEEMNRQAIAWKKSCGANLVVFSTAFDPMRINKLNNTTIRKMIDSNYIRPLEISGKINEFLELCLLSSLDINAPYRALWGHGIDDLFPEYIRNGLIIRVEQECRLFHSSFGELIISVSLPESAGDNRTVKICNQLLQIIERCPSILFSAYQRICINGYNHFAIGLDFIEVLKENASLVVKCFCKAPYQITNVFIAEPSLYPAEMLPLTLFCEEEPAGASDLLQNLELSKVSHIVAVFHFLGQKLLKEQTREILSNLMKRDKIFEMLKLSELVEIVALFRLVDEMDLSSLSVKWVLEHALDTSLYNKILFSACQFIRKYLEYLDEIGLENISKKVLDKLLNDGLFFERLLKQPCDFITSFLRYAETKLPNQDVKDYVIRLTLNAHFIKRMAATKCNLIAYFLQYMMSLELREQADVLLKELFNNRDFFTKLIGTQRTLIVPFTRYLQRHGYELFLSELTEALETRTTLSSKTISKDSFTIISDMYMHNPEEYQHQVSKMISEQIEIFPTYLNFLISRNAKDEVCNIIERWIKHLKPEVFRNMLKSANIEHLRAIQRFITKKAEYSLCPDLWNELISAMKERGFYNIVPDSEFPQSKLLALDAHSLVNLFKKIRNEFSKHRLNCVFSSLISDLELYNEWLQNLTSEQKYIYNFALDYLDIIIPEGIETY